MAVVGGRGASESIQGSSFRLFFIEDGKLSV